MPTVMPASELLRRAVAHINDVRADDPQKAFPDIIDETAMRFNLSPLDCEALLRLFAVEKTPESSRAE